MSDLLKILLLTTGAGLAIPIGGLVARVEQIRPSWLENELRHGIMAFGGGILLAAVGLALVPEGLARLSLPLGLLSFALGGLAFLGIDLWLSRRQTSASQLVAVVSDFLPEAIALGAAAAEDSALAGLLALLIALQNLPEGFNAYRELVDSGGLGKGRILLGFFALVPLGAFAGLAGHLWLRDHPAVIGVIMLFASGGILYLIFQDIAPQAKLKRSFAPPLGAVLGFILGVACHQIMA